MPGAVKVTQLIGVRLGGGQNLPAEGSKSHRVCAVAADQELAVEVAFQQADLQGHRGRIEPMARAKAATEGYRVATSKNRRSRRRPP